MARLKVGVLISGRGSNLQALIDAAADPGLSGRNRPRDQQPAGGGRASNGRPAPAIAHRAIAAPEPARRFAAAADAALRQSGAASSRSPGICAFSTAGLSRPGATGWSTSTRRCCRLSRACTRSARRSRPACGFPAAPCISCATRSIPGRSSRRPSCRCTATMTRTRLSARILAAEHRLYPLAVRLFAEGRLRIDGDAGRDRRRVRARGSDAQPVGGACLARPVRLYLDAEGYQPARRTMAAMDPELERHRRTWIGFTWFIKISLLVVV